MSLGEYKKKRNLKSSREPSAKVKKSSGKKLTSREHKFKGKVKPSDFANAGKDLISNERGRELRKPIRLSRFVIHEHHASHLHWDLRLEMNGVLKSWAVPKTPPSVKGIKRLAIQVENHPLAYAKFHGVIPEGNYGAGKVLIWDKGKYNLIEKNPTKIIFEIHGKKLTGKYALIKTSYGGKKNSWLFFKI